jgi:hypothetical protein
VTQTPTPTITVTPVCGDSVRAGGETCDPPGVPVPPNGNLCRDNCTYCGDHVVQLAAGEICDDGNSVSGCRADQPQRPLDACLNSCQFPICDDPSKMTLHADGFDLVKVHGRLIVDVANVVNFGNEFTVRITRRMCSNDSSRACSFDGECGGGTCTNQVCSHDPSVLCTISAECAALSPGSSCSELSPDSIVFEQTLPLFALLEGNAGKWRYQSKGAKVLGGIQVMKITGKPVKTCAGGLADGTPCTTSGQCVDGQCLGYYSLKLKGWGDVRDPVADMQTQIISGAQKWAVRGAWQQLSRGWKIDKKSQFLEPYP